MVHQTATAEIMTAIDVAAETKASGGVGPN